MIERCDLSDLCQELRGEADTEFSREYRGDPATRVLLAFGELRAVLDLSPLVEGHLLIAPVDHYLNFAEVMRSLPGQLDDLASRLLPAYRRAFGDVMYLEHGSSSDLRGSACISHAHLHVLPLAAQQISARMTNEGLVATDLGPLASLADWADRDISYYMVSDTASAEMFGAGQLLPKQYLRAVVARELELEDGTWDWAAYVRHDVGRRTITRLQEQLELSDRS